MVENPREPDGVPEEHSLYESGGATDFPSFSRRDPGFVAHAPIGEASMHPSQTAGPFYRFTDLLPHVIPPEGDLRWVESHRGAAVRAARHHGTDRAMTAARGRSATAELSATPMLLEATGLEKSFGPPPASRGADLAIRAGEIIAAMGPGGSGKSTLLHCVPFILPPDSGSVSDDGEESHRTAGETLARLCRRPAGPPPDLRDGSGSSYARRCGRMRCGPSG